MVKNALAFVGLWVIVATTQKLIGRLRRDEAV